MVPKKKKDAMNFHYYYQHLNSGKVKHIPAIQTRQIKYNYIVPPAFESGKKETTKYATYIIDF